MDNNNNNQVGLNYKNDEKQCIFPDFTEEERNKMDGVQKWVIEEEERMNEEEEHYNPYIRLYADCEDWGYGDGMPAAWRQ